jgi:hypothetical protein
MELLKNIEIQEEKNQLLVLENMEDDEAKEETTDLTDIDLDIDITKKMEANDNVQIKILVDILLSIEKDQNFINKHSNKHIQNVIEKKNENDKESNLKFIQDLDRETWSILKTMIVLGMDTWKNLSGKNKDLYIPSTAPTDGVTLTEAETTDNLREQARSQLGDTFTNEQFNEWRNNHEQNSKEDHLANQEMDIRNTLADDDDDITEY